MHTLRFLSSGNNNSFFCNNLVYSIKVSNKKHQCRRILLLIIEIKVSTSFIILYSLKTIKSTYKVIPIFNEYKRLNKPNVILMFQKIFNIEIFKN